MVDKFIQYQKIPSLQYYLLIEPDKPLVIFNQKNEDGDWMAHTFTAVTDRIKLPQLDLEISLSDIYGQ
jgi:Uma2 family endonuclease